MQIILQEKKEEFVENGQTNGLNMHRKTNRQKIKQNDSLASQDFIDNTGSFPCVSIKEKWT